jgi:hypothetical protein
VPHIDATDLSYASGGKYGTYGVCGVDGRWMVEVGLSTNCGRSVRIEGLFRPFAFRRACRSHQRFRPSALFTLIHSIDFSARNREIYGMYGTYGGSVNGRCGIYGTCGDDAKPAATKARLPGNR